MFHEQALDPKKLEMLKLQMEGETERPFREKFYQLEKELEKYRAECNSLKYEFSFVKSEYEHDRQEHQQIIEEMRLRHEAEVNNIWYRNHVFIISFIPWLGVLLDYRKMCQCLNMKLIYFTANIGAMFCIETFSGDMTSETFLSHMTSGAGWF